MDGTLAESRCGTTQEELKNVSQEDTPEDAENLAMEVLSPKPPPDDIKPDELVAFVVSGGLLHPSSPPSKAESLSSSVEVLQRSTCPASSPGEVKPANSTLNKLVLSGSSIPLWRRMFHCMNFSSSSDVTSKSEKQKKSDFSRAKGNHRVSSSGRFTRLCTCFSRGEPWNEEPIRSELSERTVTDNQQGAFVPVNNGDQDTTTVRTSASELVSNGTHHLPILVFPNIPQENGDPPLVEQKSLLPTILPHDVKKKCFVIDLDETLVHSSFATVTNPDFKIRVDIAGRAHQVFVLKRPFVDLFLQKMAPLYECVLFTASLSEYADPVADLLDPDRVFRHRLFRESCCFFNGNYVKDLGQLGRDINQTVILDNSPVSYLFHPSNAVHILTWFDNPEDRALLDLIAYFEKLAEAQNVPEFLAEHPPPASAVAGIPHFYQPVFHSISVTPPMPSSLAPSSGMTSSTFPIQRHPPIPQSGHDSPITSVLYSHSYAPPYCNTNTNTLLETKQSGLTTTAAGDQDDNQNFHPNQEILLSQQTDQCDSETEHSRAFSPLLSTGLMT